MGSDNLVSDTFLVVFVVLFCGVFTTLLAVWHKDSHHQNYAGEEVLLEAGTECADCPKRDTLDQFCDADFGMIVRVGQLLNNVSTTERSYNFRKLRILKRAKHLSTVLKKSSSLLLKSSERCSFYFEENTDYFLSGRIISMAKGTKLLAVVSACDLKIKWSTLSLEEMLMYKDILSVESCQN